MPKVSIIMGSYNSSKTIIKCLNSIRNQTFSDWECIICDDCSKDDSYKILLEYSKMDKRFIILHNEENKRLAYSLNKCLKNAKGEYIARVDTDDYCKENRLEVQVDFLDKNPMYAVCGSGMYVFDEYGKITIRKGKYEPTKKDMLKGVPFAHPTIMIRKKVLDDLEGYTVSKETMRAEDLDLWFRFFARGYTGVNLQDCLYYYREETIDFSKRTIKAAWLTSKVFLKGYKMLKFPFYQRVLAFKPVLSALIPNKIMKNYHQRKKKNNEK